MRKRPWFRFNQVYVLPTGFGILYGVSLLLMLLMAYTYNNNLAYLLTFFLTSFGLAALWSTHVYVRDLKIVAEKDVCELVGDTRIAPARTAHGLWAQAPADLAPVSSPIRAVGDSWACDRRGVFRVDTLRVSSSFPTGLCRAWKFVPLELTWYSSPRPEDRGLAPGGGEEDDADGRRYRDHDMGDLQGLSPAGEHESDSRIDWKALARGLGRLKKDFEDNAGDSPFIRFKDTEALTDPEMRLRQFAHWVNAAAAKSRHWRAELPDGRVSSSLTEIRRALAAWEPT